MNQEEWRIQSEIHNVYNKHRKNSRVKLYAVLYERSDGKLYAWDGVGMNAHYLRIGTYAGSLDGVLAHYRKELTGGKVFLTRLNSAKCPIKVYLPKRQSMYRDNTKLRWERKL